MSASKLMGYRPSPMNDNLSFLSCPDVFTAGMVRILKMAKASEEAKSVVDAQSQSAVGRTGPGGNAVPRKSLRSTRQAAAALG